MHDLRHSYASILVSAGLSLPVIGALLGHAQPRTTARYAHLFDDPLREATERVGAIVEAARKPAETRRRELSLLRALLSRILPKGFRSRR
jgi:ATP phosphoribosyltransferase regulatory subunit HisZ